ncbi:MAG: response regulator transcription factor [Patescibacteria group bacterium]|jgi:DNA-binding response OmpR family regulator|nr:response regulator transcription factor [Patescibacteria group bacterium]
MKILIIDDEKDIISFVRNGLKSRAHSVDVAYDAKHGLFLARSNHYDLIILDYNLPDKNGLEILQEIRQAGQKIPILALSVKAETNIKTEMFKNGVDDYVTKPFLLEELLWRVEALLRRPLTFQKNKLKLGDLQLDRQRQLAIRQGRRIYLTSKEYALLELFFRRKEELLSRSQIMENVWENNADPFSNTIEAHIMSLRKKLNAKGEKDYIHTFAGRGYKFSLSRF